MQIRVQIRGKNVTIDISLDSTVIKLKEKLSEKHGVPLEQIILSFNNQVMSNDQTLSSYGVVAESTITLQTFQDNQKSQTEEINKLREEAKNNKIENERLQELVTQLNSRVQEQDRKHRKLQSDNDDITTEFEQSKRQLNQKENEVAELQNQIDQEQFSSKKSGQVMQDSQVSGKPQQQQFQQEAMKLKFMVENLESEKQRLTEEMRTDKQSLQMKVDEAARYKEELFEKKYQVKDLERDLKLLNEKVMSSQESGTVKETFLQAELDRQQVYFKKMEEKLQKVEDLNKFHEIENVKNQYKSNLRESGHPQSDELEQKIKQQEKQIDLLQNEKRKLTIELENVQLGQKNQQSKQVDLLSSVHERNYQKEIFVQIIIYYENKDLNDIIQKQKSELQSKQIAYEDVQMNLSKYKKDSFESGKKLKELEESIDNMKNFIKEKDRKYKDLERQITNLQSEIDDSQRQQDFYKTQINQLKMNLGNQSSNSSEAFNAVEKQMGEYERLQREKDGKKQKEKDEQAYKDEMMAARNQSLKVEKDQMSNLLQQEKGQRLKQGKFLKQQMMETHGKIEVCFLVDVTASMDPFKEQAMMCIDQSMSSIKEKTNRDVLWGAVAYQDFDELKKLGGLYRQIGFLPDGKQIQTFLRKIDCAGGGDFAEDVRGGIKQMVQNLTWSKTFKIAMLICDAPTHGKKYNGGVSDRHPDEDIRDAIEMLIDNNILFVGILFNKCTLQMFEAIKEMYKKYDREELLLLANLEGTSEGKIWEELVALISLASQRATQTNNKGTKTKNPSLMKQSQDGAMEALCKTLKNPFEFDKQPGIKVVETQFTVYRVEIKQEAFEAQIENIENLNLKRDFMVNKEGQWNCIRTQKPFAFGQMKAVYLMKRQNYEQVEVYVVKMPLGDNTYKSLDEAIQECRSHLISKCLMKKFIKDLRVARDAKNPRLQFIEPQYSDFLILQENEKSFWIAERFFPGDFVKYNNNFGFVSDDDTEINHLAQAFTYYTFFVSNFSYMVSDVQGVGLYFTDPAVNTNRGSYDETDMGKDGQSMFMVAYSGKQQLGRTFLDLLGIKME